MHRAFESLSVLVSDCDDDMIKRVVEERTVADTVVPTAFHHLRVVRIETVLRILVMFETQIFLSVEMIRRTIVFPTGLD